MKTVSAPSGIGAPVKMRTAWPGLIGARADAPACDAARHRKRLLRSLRQVAAAHGITVDGGIGEGRQRQRRRDIARQNAAVGIDERDGLDLLHRRRPRAAMMPTASSTDIIGPPKAKQSSDSCAMCLSALRCALLESTSSTGIADRRIMAATASISSRWAIGSVVSTAASVAMPTMPGSSGNSNGLPLAARYTSILRCGSRLKPSTTTRSTRDIFASSSGSRGSARAAQFVHQRPAPGRGHQHLGRAGFAVPPGILAGHVDIEFVMGVLDDGDAQACPSKCGISARQQGGLAGAAPSREANHFHRILRNLTFFSSLRAKRSNPAISPPKRSGLLRRLLLAMTTVDGFHVLACFI